MPAMKDPVDHNPQRHYRWPWFLLAAVVLGIILGIVWMSVAVHREKEERNFSAPLPSQSH